METDNTRQAFAEIKYLGLGFSYIHLGFRVTEEGESWKGYEVETVVRGIFRTSTAEERFDIWTDAFSSEWSFDN